MNSQLNMKSYHQFKLQTRFRPDQLLYEADHLKTAKDSNCLLLSKDVNSQVKVSCWRKLHRFKVGKINQSKFVISTMIQIHCNEMANVP